MDYHETALKNINLALENNEENRYSPLTYYNIAICRQRLGMEHDRAFDKAETLCKSQFGHDHMYTVLIQRSREPTVDDM